MERQCSCFNKHARIPPCCCRGIGRLGCSSQSGCLTETYHLALAHCCLPTLVQASQLVSNLCIGSCKPFTCPGRLPLQDGDGQVTGANLKLAWDKERIAFSAITHHISEYGATHHDLATVEDFEVQRAEGQLRVTLRVRIFPAWGYLSSIPVFL